MPQTPLGRFGYLDWGNWLYGLVAGFISGAAGAVVSGVAITIKDPNDFAFGSSNFFQLVFFVFLANGVIAAAGYLHSKPLPEYVKTTTTEERTAHSTIVTGTGNGGVIEQRSPHKTTVTKVVEEVKPAGVTTTVIDPPKTTITEDASGAKPADKP